MGGRGVASCVVGSCRDKIINEVLNAATGDTAKNLSPIMQNWCKLIVQSPHHKVGYTITPTAASGLAAFYSDTVTFVTMLASLQLL